MKPLLLAGGLLASGLLAGLSGMFSAFPEVALVGVAVASGATVLAATAVRMLQRSPRPY